MLTLRRIYLAALTASAIAVPSVAQVQNPPAASGMTAAQQSALDTATTTAQDAKTAAGAAQSAADAARAAIPTPATSMPPGVTDSGSIGTATTSYALANHTHASKARKARVLVPVAGFIDVTFATPFTTGITPLCAVTAEATAGDTNVVNAQIDGVTSATGFRIRITRTAVTAVSLLGLSVLSVPTQIATYTHYICLEP